MENRSRLGSLEGTIGKAKGTSHFYSDFSALKSTSIQEGVRYTIELKNVLEGVASPNSLISYASDHLSQLNIPLRKLLGEVEAKNYFGN